LDIAIQDSLTSEYMINQRFQRLVEASLVSLFFIQSSRISAGILLKMLEGALSAGQIDVVGANAQLGLLGILIVPWLSVRRRDQLPNALFASALVVSVARLIATFQLPYLRLAAALLAVGMAGYYFACLVRANRHTWVLALIFGVVADMLFRSYDTYDVSLHTWIDIVIGARLLHFPWVVLQIALSSILLGFSILARRNARNEPYEPSALSFVSGLALGGFWAVEALVLSLPNVLAHWADVSIGMVTVWLLLATMVPLVPSARAFVVRISTVFDERLRGWVWLFLLILLIVLGRRLAGLWSLSALLVAQVIAVCLLWGIPQSPSTEKKDDITGPAMSLGLIVYWGIIYGYSLSFEYAQALPWLRGQGLVVILIAVALLGMSRLAWHEDEPLNVNPIVTSGTSVILIVPIVILALMLSTRDNLRNDPVIATTIHVATYNINGGYDADRAFQLDRIALTISASQADLVILQEVDFGQPMGYSIDAAYYLARRLGMYHIFHPTIEKMDGVAIISRWPIQKTDGVLVPGSGLQRGLLTGIVGTGDGGRRLLVLGVQLNPGTDQERLNQLASILSITRDEPLIVLAGDLGATPSDIVYQQLLASGFTDPNTVLGIERGYTAPSRNPVVRYDYVLLRGGVPVDSRQVDSAASDHRLIVVEIGWP
jgi:endonuclease/exonuclease/phosphatase family metal-dependent hydrolase